MMYVSEALANRMGKQRTSADMVFEYSSKSTANYDQTTKSDTYLALSVRERWLVDSDRLMIEVRYARLKNGQPGWKIHRYGKTEYAESEVLAGWRVSVDELFEGLIQIFRQLKRKARVSRTQRGLFILRHRSKVCAT